MKTINSLRSKLLALTLALMASVSTFAYEFEYSNDFHIDGFAYKVLPSNTLWPYGAVALIEIADCTADVIIPDTITYTFSNTTVTYIVTTLGGGAALFTNSAKETVKSISIPKGISVINSPLFAGCSNLTSIVVDSENHYYDSRENCNAIITTAQNPYFTPNTLIAGCKTTNIPNSVAEIGDKAFYNSAIESITIPTGVTKIGRSAFNKSNQLSSVTLPASLKEIGYWAFADCLSLNTIICYAIEPPTISSNTFFGSNPIYNNPSVYVPAESVEAYKNAEHWKWFAKVLPIEPTSYKSQWCDTWNVLELKYRYSSYTTKEDFETWRYYLAQDTIINNYTYTAVTRQTTKVPEGVYPFIIPEPEYVAAVRFTNDRKVYIYYDNTEYLLYDFNVQPGDELTVFAGINHYHSHHTNTIRVDEVERYPGIYPFGTEISLSVFPDFYGDERPACFGVTKWVEGVGDLCGFITGADCGLSEYQTALLCAYKDGNTEYTTEYEEYAEYGCEYNSGENKEYILTLPGLQRTDVELSTIEGDVDPYHLSFKEYTPTLVNGKLYLCDGRNYFREENNQVLLYSPEFEIYEDVVLYDWTLEVGDTLPYHNKSVYRESDYIVTDVSTITLLDGKEYKKWTLACGIEYIEGIGAINGEGFGTYFCIQHTAHPATYIDTRLVCASRNGQLLYKMDDAEMEQLETECLCEYNAEQKSEDIFPTLWGLQRTSSDEWYDGCGENKSYLFAPKEVKEINGKLYLKCGGVFLREEDSKVLIYSFPYEKDFVLYDYTLEVGGTLQNLGIDIYSFPELEYAAVVDYIAYEDYDVETDEFIIKKEPLGSKRVQEVSTITLLDGKEYKRWLFGNDWENGNYYIEGIGKVGGAFGGDYIDIANPYGIPACYLGERLVCASKNGQLLYQMDDAEMERLGAECLCDYNSGPKKDNAKNGKIGGRPTPTQWNMLEFETKEVDGTPTILRAETFSYTLENDSIIANNKTFYQLARQSTKDTAITKSFVGALHFGEDEDNRVYFLRDGVEYVLYDFTAEPGDTIEIFAGINNYPQETTYTHVVTGKDTLDNGACRMMLEVVFPEEIGSDLEQQHLQKIWLAGLGSIDGIVHNAAQRTSDAHAAPAKSASSETQTSVMLCAWREDSCLYTTNHPEYDTFGCVYNQDPTAVENLTSPSSYQKIIHEGTLLILHEGKVYNVIGIQIK